MWLKIVIRLSWSCDQQINDCQFAVGENTNSGINYPDAILLKAGWDNEIDFNQKNASVPGSKKPVPEEKKETTEPAKANEETEK